LGQVIAIDLVLAGDNAIVVGIAAAGVPLEQRPKVIFRGIGAAIALRDRPNRWRQPTLLR
jgi:predicted tellurium resistance membrane protein TerC